MKEQTKSHYSDEVAAAWREQLAEAAENPWLAELLLEYGERILRRFTYFYEQLRTLSRRARRYIRRKLALKLSAAAFLLALSGMHVPVAYAAGITVDGTDCTLANAITAANTDAPVGSCTAGSGADTLYITNDITLTSALPAITTKITIEGNGHTIERDSGAGNFRILEVDGSGANNGNLTLNDATITGGNVDGDGGGVLNYNGTVDILNDSLITGNYASGYGGGVANHARADDGYTATATITITNSTISDNTAGSDGGGVSNFAYARALTGEATATGTITINNSTISGNTSDSGNGGGVSNRASYYGYGTPTPIGTVTINNSTISGNTADDGGGGVANYYAHEVTITNSTISGNSADNGGGVYNYEGTATITNSTISGNDALDGGGVYNVGVLTITNSIVSGNTATEFGNEVYDDATVNADDYNLFGDSSETNYEAFHNTFTPGVNDITATSDGTIPTALGDILDGLADNGGPTLTHAIFPGSPALDAGDPDISSPPEYDQRGSPFRRVVGRAIDIGAYEYVPPVGGVTAPVDSLELLAPATGLLAAIIALATSGIALVKRRRD